MRTEAQVDLENPFAAGDQRLQKQADELLEVPRVGNRMGAAGLTLARVYENQFHVRRKPELAAAEFAQTTNAPGARLTILVERRSEPLVKLLVTEPAGLFDHDLGQVGELLGELNEVDPSRDAPQVDAEHFAVFELVESSD